MADNTLVCDQRVSGETLSALRDDLLSPAEMDRIYTHAAQCPACQAQLAGFEAVALALRQQREIEPDGRLLESLRVRAAARTPHRRVRLHLPTRRIWRSVGALGSVAAVLLLFIYFLASGPGRVTGPLTSRTPTASATAATTPTAAPLDWRTVTAPPNFQGMSVMDVSPADGNTLYACGSESQAQGGSVALWVSRDRAAHWQRATAIPARTATNLCFLQADMQSPGTAVVAVTWTPMGASPQISTFTSYLTNDYGLHWTPLTFPRPAIIYQLATQGATTYAILRGDTSDELAVSADGLRTWKRVDTGITPGLLQASAFWLNPTSGALLVWWSGLWESADGGAHWTQLQVPGGALADPSANVVVRQPVAGEPWQLCVATNNTLDRSDPQPNKLTCSKDGGVTWVQRPGLNITFANGAKGSFVAPVSVFAIADDGAVLAEEIGLSGQVLYRLPAGGQQWQSLGQAPSTSASYGYVPTPGNGYLDTFPTMLVADYVP